MSKQNYYVVSRPQGGWAVKKEGSQRASAVTGTQKESIEIGKDLAKKSQGELTVQGRDHKFREKNSYGNDPRNIKG
ncbi:DUF2188 domain-containing protein [Ekhidna sp.]|jgi:uncharacterized protein YdaT|uniref:DUF2188 domain-containing protein n=1 Tax=Ekhidna sp. TaxID=2608089 RepID=UPI0032F013CB